MIILIIVGVIDLLLNSLMIGVTLFAIFGEKLSAMNYKKGLVLFFPVVLLLDVVWMPVIAQLDISVKIGNQQVAEFFGLENGIYSPVDMAAFGWYELSFWLIQTVIAYFGGHLIYEKFIGRALTSRSS